jgi:hypothetical protein
MEAMTAGSINPDDLGKLVWCAIDYDRRLPHGNVPPLVWEALTPEWRGKIMAWKGAERDHLGAEVRPR